MRNFTQNQIQALINTAKLASELCNAIDAQAEDIGGTRPVSKILQELGPATDESDSVVRFYSKPVLKGSDTKQMLRNKGILKD